MFSDMLTYFAIIFCIMTAVDMKPVSFRTSSPKLKKIDALAHAQQRDRTFILNEAMQEYHASLIQEGLRDADVGRVVSHEDVGRELAAHRARRKSKATR
jgi:predicted transcriptional regulator